MLTVAVPANSFPKEGMDSDSTKVSSPKMKLDEQLLLMPWLKSICGGPLILCTVLENILQPRTVFKPDLYNTLERNIRIVRLFDLPVVQTNTEFKDSLTCV